MNYELAKELKDAGFPQKGEGEYIAPDGEVIYSGCWNEYNTEDCVALPTLEELIEACGDEFECIYRVVNPDKTTLHFVAYAFGQDRGLKLNGETIFSDCNAKGMTAREAVARLWLALHNK